MLSPPPLAASTLGRPLYNLQGGMRFMTAIGHSKDGVGTVARTWILSSTTITCTGMWTNL
jgi:hypothetical protein